MRLNNLAPAAGEKSQRRRLGRGNASGRGTTAGKGTKGQKARSGGAKAFYRGMSSRSQRYGKLPGFNNRWRVEYDIVNVSDLERFDADSIIDAAALRSAGIVRGKQSKPIKLLGDGEITKSFTIRLNKVTRATRDKVIAAGGRVEEVSDDTSST